MYILGHALTGISVLYLTMQILNKMKQIDKEHMLPTSFTIADCLVIFALGATAYHGVSVQTAVMTITLLYLSIMAYTDAKTKTVYSIFSYVAIIAGVSALLVQSENIKVDLIVLVLYAGVVLIGYLIKAWAFGDVEVLWALYPIVRCFIMPTRIDAILTLCIIVLFALMISVFASIHIKPLRIERKHALVPGIAVSFAALNIVMNIVM